MRIGIPALILFLILLPAVGLGQDNLRPLTYDAGVFDPARGPVSIGYRILKDAEEAEILVEDFRGQVIDRLNYVNLRAGENEFSWNGLDDAREPFPEGRYRIVMTVRFTDGTVESAVIEVRIAGLPDQKAGTVPLVPPPKTYIYKIDGSFSTFWLRNTEDPENTYEYGENRFRTHLNIEGKNRTFDGIFAVRRPYHQVEGDEQDFDGSQAFAEQRWQDGRVRGIFRTSLGNFDDPMKLFSDFRTERKKFGGRFDQTVGWFRINALGFDTEGDLANNEQGLAGRLTFGPPNSWRLGVTIQEDKILKIITGLTQQAGPFRVTCVSPYGRALICFWNIPKRKMLKTVLITDTWLKLNMQRAICDCPEDTSTWGNIFQPILRIPCTMSCAMPGAWRSVWII